jgi:hypothetical protein
MKLAVAAFVALLVLAQAVGDLDRQLGLPLSQFRDAGPWWMGYLLFASLLLVGVLYTLALWRRQREPEACVSGQSVLLLTAVMATPSFSVLHHLCALLLMLLLFVYYAVLLHRAGGHWLFSHLAIPFLLVGATQFHSYGLWQKAFILYFVLAALAHHHLLVSLNGRPRRRRGLGELRKRKVYTLGPTRQWSRRPVRG